MPVSPGTHSKKQRQDLFTDPAADRAVVSL